MAIDTAEKRFSMLNFGSTGTVHLLFEPDGAVDADDRAHLLDLYSGIALGAPVVVTDSRSRMLLHATTHLLAVS